MEKLIDEIIGLEWCFFDRVRNEGGRAPCQDDWKTFRIMRGSQFMAWNRPLLESWHGDLLQARERGYNPMTEKYGYMMCIADPEANLELAASLPPVSEEKKALSRKIIERLVPQNAAFRRRYPLLAAHARPLRTADESGGDMTSMETYQLGELWTYSRRTLTLLDEHLRDLEAAGINYPELVIRNSLLQRGVSGLEEAEAFLAKRQRDA